MLTRMALRPYRPWMLSAALCGALGGLSIPSLPSPAWADDCCRQPLARPAAPDAAPLTAADLDRLEGQMRGGDPEARLRAARAVAAAGPDGYEAYVAHLRRPVTGRIEALRALVWGIWGQYPNPEYPKGPGKDPPMWFVRPEPKWAPPPRVPGQPRPKRPPPHDPDAVDWLEALARLDLSADELTRDLDAKEAAAARAEALMRVALLRAIAGAGTTGTGGQREAVYPLFDYAFVSEGLFRDECGRVIRSMGSYAVPSLIRIYNNRQRTNAKMRRYASYQLDRMDRLRPSKAVASAPDDLTRAEILHAYGDARALDAVDAVLGQVDAASHRVRREARWAWLRYVDGPPPPPSPKRKRKLPGGAEEAEEKEDYLNYREMATLAIQKLMTELDGQAPDPKLSAKQLTDRLLAHYDRRREAEYGQLFDKARAQEEAGDLAGAVDSFGWILANQPDHHRRAEMARVFGRLGQQLAEEGEDRGDEGRTSRALGLLRQALALDPAQSGSRRMAAQVHYLDGRQAQRRGADGVADFERAVAADGSYFRARQALEAARLRNPRHGVSWWTVAAALGLLVPLLYLLWRRGRRDEELGHPDEGSGAAATL
jgi:hypothetical protein